MGFRLGPIIVHPDVPAVACSSVSIGFAPPSSVERTFQVPATLLSEMVAAAAASPAFMVSVVAPAPTDRSSALVQARTAAQQRMAKGRICPPELGDAEST